MRRRRWAVAAGATLTFVWLAAFNALWGVTTNAFDLSAWRWQLLGAAVALTVGAGLVAALTRVRSGGARFGRVWAVPRPDEGVVDRPELSAALIRLLTEQAGGAVGVSTGLFGAGGFGKTTLARQVCWAEPVRRRFRDAVWVTLGEEPAPADLLAKVDSVAHALTGQHVDTSDVEQAGLRLGQVLDEQREVLLVVDDVWRAADLRPFLHGGMRSCTRLVITRRPRLLPDQAARRSVRVDQLSAAQAGAVLAAAGA
jgi:NB-ARC domain